MALNVPNGAKKNLSFGPGILYITTTWGVVDNYFNTPNIDIGYVRGATFSVTTQKLEVFQGAPKQKVAQFLQQNDCSLQVTGIEWNLVNLATSLGIGSVAGNVWGAGGSSQLASVGLLYRHRTPALGTVDIRMWKAQGSGELSVNFGDDIQEFPYTFNSLASTNRWDGGVLADDSSLFAIQYIPGT